MTALAAFTFLRPGWLLALPALALLWWGLRRRRARAGGQGLPQIAPHLRAALTIGRNAQSRLTAPDLILPAAMLMALAAAGPAWRPAPSPFVIETAPLVIALDLSSTMEQADIAPTRLERAKQKIRDLIAARAGGRVGLVAYAGSAHLVMPLTDDPTVLQPFLDGLEPGLMPTPGRKASAALTLAETLLAQEPAPGSILFVTDGIDPADIAAFPAGGSARAALIVAPDGGGAEVRDWSSRANVAAVSSTVEQSDIAAVQRALASSLARAGAAEGALADDGWLLAIPAGLILLLWFRRGTTLRWLAVVAGLALTPQDARAEGLADWFWTPDQQGARAYADHRYAEAAGLFADPLWRAAALYRTGRYEEAAALWEPVPTAETQINRGLALIHAHQYEPGRAAFEAALALEPGNETARRNLEIAKRIIAYLNEAREAEDTEDQSPESAPDDMVEDLTGEGGRQMRIDGDTGLSEDSAEQWMRQVETKPADFLKTRFAVEAQGAAP
ncbi:VWA domain-containing protein [Amaricoccus sp.]|uniref:vWA domain-containing protein n=1 Tax=Amaricoccus sp. TaxID=1872485 RepID=UPI001B52FBDF|nr:VWA domain-containing protein [Amaricoccus sp.]MBP7002186.1 VWA domain-containing protein [Amaricoccus sp.]